jgi:hypothetical protein
MPLEGGFFLQSRANYKQLAVRNKMQNATIAPHFAKSECICLTAIGLLFRF